MGNMTAPYHLRSELKIMLWGANLWYFADGLLGPLFAVFTQRIGGNVLQIAGAYATYLFVTGILIMLIGNISDHRDKARLMLVGYLVNTGCTFGYLFIHAPWQLFLLQAGFGIAVGLENAAWFSLYARFEDRAHEGRIWGLAGGQGRLATGAAMLLGGVIVTKLGFTVLFVAMGSVMALATLVQARILRYVET